MKPDDYIKSIINKYAITGRSQSVTLAAAEIYSIIQRWAGN